MCTEATRAAMLEAGVESALLRLDTGEVPGITAREDDVLIFAGAAPGLHLLLGVDADGSARLMAMETAPLAVVTWFGSCEEL